MAIEDNHGPHRCLKITLTVLYAIGVALTIIFLVLAVLALLAVSTIDTTDPNSKTPEKDRQNKEAAVFILIAAIVILALSLLFDSLALFAIVKEKKYLLAVFTFFQVVFCGLYLWVGYLSTAIGHVVMAIMLGVFTYIVFKRQKV